jgi:hypothetical protein
MEEEKIKKDEELEKGKKKKQDDKLPYCITTSTAEHARANEDDEPCDDGRSGELDN